MVGGARRGLAVAEQQRRGGVFQQAVEKALPAVLPGQVHHPQVQGVGGQPAVFQMFRVGVDHHPVALALDGARQQMPLQGIVGDHADPARGGHYWLVSRVSPSSSRRVTSSSLSWNGLPR